MDQSQLLRQLYDLIGQLDRQVTRDRNSAKGAPAFERGFRTGRAEGFEISADRLRSILHGCQAQPVALLPTESSQP